MRGTTEPRYSSWSSRTARARARSLREALIRALRRGLRVARFLVSTAHGPLLGVYSARNRQTLPEVRSAIRFWRIPHSDETPLQPRPHRVPLGAPSLPLPRSGPGAGARSDRAAGARSDGAAGARGRCAD